MPLTKLALPLLAVPRPAKRAVAGSWLIALPLFITHGFYRVIFRYSGAAAMQMAFRPFALYGLLYASVGIGNHARVARGRSSQCG